MFRQLKFPTRGSVMPRWLLVLLVLLFSVLPLTACGTDADAGEPGAVGAADCLKAPGTTIAPNAKAIALVVDNTRSSATDGLPQAAEAALEVAQKRGDQVLLVPVEGAGRPQRIVREIALDPYPGEDTAVADRARPMMIKCVGLWAGQSNMLPTGPGSAVLDAVQMAARQKPVQIVVVSDGVNNVPPFDANELRFDADAEALAKNLQAAGALAPELHDATILWTGLGETNPPLPQPLRANLQEMWSAALKTAGAKVTFDSRSGRHRDVQDQRPADQLQVPEITTVTAGCAVEISVPGGLLFAGNSALLQPDADVTLQRVADQLHQHPTWSARIVGHAAAYGSTAGQQQKSRERADAVAQRLVALGMDQSRLRPEALGASEPLVDEFPGGLHDEGAAARNRRVEIVLGPEGCQS